MSFPGCGVRVACGTVTSFAPYLTTNTCSSTCFRALHEIPVLFTNHEASAWQTPWRVLPTLATQAKHSTGFSFDTQNLEVLSFPFLISYPLSEAFPLQSLGMILTPAPQCSFTFAVFWQATGKEVDFSSALRQRSHWEKTKYNL